MGDFRLGKVSNMCVSSKCFFVEGVSAGGCNLGNIVVSFELGCTLGTIVGSFD